MMDGGSNQAAAVNSLPLFEETLRKVHEIQARVNFIARKPEPPIYRKLMQIFINGNTVRPMSQERSDKIHFLAAANLWMMT